MDIVAFVAMQIKTNPMVSAALIAAPATILTYTARALPMKIVNSIRKAVSVTLRFNNDMPDYAAISQFVTKDIIISAFSRNYTYQTERQWDDNSCTEATQHHGLTAGYGTHIGRYRGSFVLVSRYMDESAQTAKFKEHLNITFFGGQKKVRMFAADVRERASAGFTGFNAVPLYINSGTWWQRAGQLPLRSLSTVFTAGGAGQRLLQAIRDFDARRDENHRLGLPHHLGILLFGEPGCGKSSLIHALASESQRSIYYLNLGSVEKDKELTDLVACGRDWSKTLLVLEDFDAAGVSVSRNVSSAPEKPAEEGEEPKKPVTLSAMLNVLDGLISPDGLIVVATTNHPEKIDPALKRSGRFDHPVELGRLGYDDFLKMCDLFKADPSRFPMKEEDTMPGADMRSMILNPERLAA